MAEIKYAGFWRRLGAVILDRIIFWILFIVTFLVLGGINSLIGGAVYSTVYDILSVFFIIMVIIIYFGYEPYFLSTTGATPGKQILGLVVVNSENKYPLSLRKALLREWIGVLLVDSFTLSLGNLLIIFDSKKQALHDKIAGTYVVHKDSLTSQAIAQVTPVIKDPKILEAKKSSKKVK